MLRPSIFGESLFDDWMDDFPFGKEFEKAMFPAKDPLYGKHAKNMMKTDVRETDDAYEDNHSTSPLQRSSHLKGTCFLAKTIVRFETYFIFFHLLPFTAFYFR